MFQTTRRALTGHTLIGLTILAFAGTAAPAQGNGNNGGSNSSPDIDSRIEVPDPVSAGSSGGELRSDHANATNEYRDGSDRVSVVVGRNRNLGLLTARQSSRRMLLDLGNELPAMAGDNPANLPVVAFGPSVPDPSGVISEVELRIAHLENVSDLGVRPSDSWTPNYCWPDNTEVPDPADPNNPLTFRRMCTTMRLEFKSGAHQWRLFFGPPNRRASQARIPTHPDTGPVVVERIFPNWTPNVDPADPTVPWVITVEPWQTNNPLHQRYGMVVGYLHYRGTKKQDPWRYVGAFDVPFASADPNSSPWLAYPLQ